MIEALLIAVRDKLRVTLPVPQGQPPQMYCDIQPLDGLPAFTATWYVAVDELAVMSDDKINLRERYAVQVKVVKKVTRYAADRLGEVYLAATTGTDASGPSLATLERICISAIHNRHDVRQRACQLAGVPSLASGDIFQQPLWYRGRGPTRAGDESFERTLRFEGGLRVQAVDVEN